MGVVCDTRSLVEFYVVLGSYMSALVNVNAKRLGFNRLPASGITAEFSTSSSRGAPTSLWA